MTNIDRNAPCPCGSTKKYKHCCQRKEKTKVIKADPRAAMVPAWLALGLQHLRADRLQPAKILYEQVLEFKPEQTDALQWLGVILHKQGNSERGIELINRAIALNPENAFYYSTLGNVLKELGQYDAAIDSYTRAIALDKNLADARNNLGIALAMQGKPYEAIEQYKVAISLVPSFAEAFNNLGTVYKGLSLQQEAIDAFGKATTLNPNYVQALDNMGNILANDKPEYAIQYVRRSLEIKPDSHQAWIAYGTLLYGQGYLSLAKQALQRSLDLKPIPGVRVLKALVLPTIMGTRQDVIGSRDALIGNLDELATEEIAIQDPVRESCPANFYLAYHGVNDRDIQIKIARFYEQACPSLLYVAKHCSESRARGPKWRIGFFSRFIAKHSVAVSFSGAIEALSQQGEFEIALISSADKDGADIAKAYPGFQGKYVKLTRDLTLARQEIAALELDILVYLDIGMDPFTYFLAFSRLARAQCVLGGHPVTTGISAIDYYLSSDSAETPDAQNHYSEKLVRMKFGFFYFQRPTLPTFFKDRKALGLPTQGQVYLCPMKLQKLHPDFDEAMGRILDLDPTGTVVLIADNLYTTWQKLLEARFEKTVPQHLRERIIFLPWVSDPNDFLSLNNAADVILDPFHFGIGTTAIATCSVGTPFVTRPSEFLRGRVGLFFAKLMDSTECVAVDCEDYAKRAVSIATNPTLRETIKKKILSNNHALFDNKEGVRDGIEFFQRISDQMTH